MTAPKKNHALPSAKEVLLLTLPQMGLMLCHLVIGMTDVWAAGRLDVSVQASIGVVAQLFAMLMLLTSLIGSGCMATVSQSLGAGLRHRADRYAGLIVMLSASAGTLIALLALLFTPFIFDIMQVAPELRPTLSTFFMAYCCQLPFYYVLIMVNSIFRAHKKVMLPFATLLFMALVNVVGDLGFGLGWFGFPALGEAGIAWTTFVCALLGLSSNIVLARHYGLLGRSSFAPWRWNRRAMPYLFKVGMPAAAGNIIAQTGSLVTLAIIGMLPENSTSVLAGMSVGSRVHSILMFPLGALNMSMVIFSGYMLGGGQRSELYSFGRKLAALTGLGLILPSLLLWFLRDPAVAFFSTDEAVQEQASLFLIFACLGGPLAAMAGILNGTFSGAGATILSCRIGAVTCWLVNIPLAWVLGIAIGWGAVGVYIAALVSQISAFCWAATIFKKKKWLEYGLIKRQNG